MQQGTDTLVLQGGVGDRLPLPLFVLILQAELPQHVEAYDGTSEVLCAGRVPRFFYYTQRALHSGREMFTDISTDGAPADGLVRVPVGAVS